MMANAKEQGAVVSATGGKPDDVPADSLLSILNSMILERIPSEAQHLFLAGAPTPEEKILRLLAFLRDVGIDLTGNFLDLSREQQGKILSVLQRKMCWDNRNARISVAPLTSSELKAVEALQPKQPFFAKGVYFAFSFRLCTFSPCLISSCQRIRDRNLFLI